MNSVTVGLNKLSFSNFKVFFNGPVTVSLSEEARNNILKSHNRFLEKLKTKDIIYGVNTGFGKLSNVLIDEKNQKQLQKNLVRSHASGTLTGSREGKQLFGSLVYSAALEENLIKITPYGRIDGGYTILSSFSDTGTVAAIKYDEQKISPALQAGAQGYIKIDIHGQR